MLSKGDYIQKVKVELIYMCMYAGRNPMLASYYIVLLLLHVLCLPKLVNIIMIIQLKHNNEFLQLILTTVILFCIRKTQNVCMGVAKTRNGKRNGKRNGMENIITFIALKGYRLARNDLLCIFYLYLMNDYQHVAILLIFI